MYARKKSLLPWDYAWYQTLNKLVNVFPFFNRMQKSTENWDNIMWRRGMERLPRCQAGEKLDDFFRALMEGKNGDPIHLEWGEIVAECNVMMNADIVRAIAGNPSISLMNSNRRALNDAKAHQVQHQNQPTMTRQ